MCACVCVCACMCVCVSVFVSVCVSAVVCSREFVGASASTFLTQRVAPVTRTSFTLCHSTISSVYLLEQSLINE